MKRLLLVSVLTPTLVLASQLNQEFHFYERSVAVELPLAQNQITVKVDEEHFTDWDAILGSDAAIDIDQELQSLWGGFYLVHLHEESNSASVLENLRARRCCFCLSGVSRRSWRECVYHKSRDSQFWRSCVQCSNRLSSNGLCAHSYRHSVPRTALSSAGVAIPLS